MAALSNWTTVADIDRRTLPPYPDKRARDNAICRNDPDEVDAGCHLCRPRGNGSACRPRGNAKTRRPGRGPPDKVTFYVPRTTFHALRTTPLEIIIHHSSIIIFRTVLSAFRCTVPTTRPKRHPSPERSRRRGRRSQLRRYRVSPLPRGNTSAGARSRRSV